MRVLAVPRKRLNVLQKSDALSEVSKRLDVKCRLTEDGSVEIEGEGGSEWIAEQVCRAIALGFEPKHALRLTDDDFFLEEIDLNAACRGSEKAVSRYKARIIGTEGKVKRTIEELSGARLAVSDDSDTVAFLGRFDDLKLAKEAVFKILDGKEVSTVYAFLEKQAKYK